MDFWDVIEERRSVRHFASEEVPADTVERILEAGISAPSAGNCQPWHFIVVRRPEVKRLLAEAAYGQHFVAEAPVVIVVCAEPARSGARYGRRGTELYCLQDTAAAVENILLAAVASGLGACWVGAFDEGAAARAVNLSEGMRPVSIIPIGRPAREISRRPGRRPLREVSRWID
ncbi:MAG: nitroreductase family protein [Anaerolineae bacterium]